VETAEAWACREVAIVAGKEAAAVGVMKALALISKKTTSMAARPSPQWEIQISSRPVITEM